MKIGDWLLAASWFAALLAFAISCQTLCGYWAGIERWQRWTGEGTVPMALNTAVGLFLLAVSVLLAIPAIIKLRSGAESSHGTLCG